MDEEEEFENAYEETVANDAANIKKALNQVIDTLTVFMAEDRIDEIDSEQFAGLLASLDFARFIVGGVMYLHGLPYCGHEHEEEDEE